MSPLCVSVCVCVCLCVCVCVRVCVRLLTRSSFSHSSALEVTAIQLLLSRLSLSSTGPPCPRSTSFSSSASAPTPASWGSLLAVSSATAWRGRRRGGEGGRGEERRGEERRGEERVEEHSGSVLVSEESHLRGGGGEVTETWGEEEEERGRGRRREREGGGGQGEEEEEG